MGTEGSEVEELAKRLDNCAKHGIWSGHFTIKTAQEAAALLRQQAQEVERLRGEVERLQTPTHYWSEDANERESAIEWDEFYMLEDCPILEPGEHADFEVEPLVVLPSRTVRVSRLENGEIESAALEGGR